ncbi:MAG: Ig-like domain repeat protein, partial [Syntrophobacteraceae bacterium]
ISGPQVSVTTGSLTVSPALWNAGWSAQSGGPIAATLSNIPSGSTVDTVTLNGIASTPGAIVYPDANGNLTVQFDSQAAVNSLGTIAQTVFYPTVEAKLSSGNFVRGKTQITMSNITSAVSLSSSPNPSNYGDSVTFMATVSAAAGTPTGTVTFSDGATVLGTGALSGGQATFATSSLSAGSHTITASYGGDANFAAGSATLGQTVNQVSTTTTLSPIGSPCTYGNSMTLTATVSPSTASGSVTFNDGSTTLGTGTISGGTASLSTSTLTGGSHSITAVYGGDTNYSTSTSPAISLTVNKATPAITWANPAAIAYGTALSSTQLDATASVPGTFAYTPPAGTVLKAGTGQTLSVTFTPTDTTDYTTATATVTINVNTATPAITWASPASIAYGTALGSTQLDASASVLGTFAYTPPAGTVLKAGAGQTLSVTFTPTDTTDYTTATATVTVTVNTATPAITWATPAAITYGTALSSTQLDAAASVPGTFAYTPPAGTVLKAGAGQTLSVTFTPTDTTDYKSATATVTINVNMASTTTSVASSQNPSTQGSSVTFTATVSPSSATGTVAFYDGSTQIGSSQTLSSGSASVSTSALAAGSNSITAVYSGNTNYATSTSPVLTQTVNSASTAMSVSPASGTYGGTATLTATMTWGGSPVTGMSVSFTLNGKKAGSATTNPSGVAIMSNVSLAGIQAGTYANGVSASCAGSATYPAVSGSNSLTVNKALLTVTATGANKVYDGTTAATATLSDNRISGDVFTDSYTSATFADKNVGNGKTVTVTGISIAGAAAGNYSLASTTITTTANITPSAIIVAAYPRMKVLNAPDPPLTYAIIWGSLAPGDSFTGALSRAAGQAVGVYTIGQGTLALSTNYTLTFIGDFFVIIYQDPYIPGMGTLGHAIMPPINSNGTSVFKQGSTVPAIFQVFDANGKSVGTAGIVSSFNLVETTSGGVAKVNEPVYSTTPSTAFNWDATNKWWIFNIGTKNFHKNTTYVYWITLNDGTVIPFQFGLN